MAIGGNPRAAPAKSSASTRRHDTAAAAANPAPPAAAHAAVTRERPGHEPRVQRQADRQQRPQPQPQPQHAQRHQQSSQQHFHHRHQQNRVGKRYRDKLTAGFESLQTTLGLDEVGERLDAVTRAAGGGGEDGSVGMGGVDGAPRRRRRPLNKARIIDLTCERVRELVGEWEVTRAEMEAMRRERALQGW